MTAVPSWPLQQTGPAQFDLLIHFCGRSPGALMTPYVPGEIADMAPWQRLDTILWEQRLLGFPPFKAAADQPMICLSESPPDHLQWLLTTRQWPAWGLIFNRQYIYDAGGGPVWSVRSQQFTMLTPEQRPWATRLDTTPGNTSDWLFEREWRLPPPDGDQALHLTTSNLVGILIDDPQWEPSERVVDTGYLIDGTTGEVTDLGNPYAQPELRPSMPPLWEATPRVCWDSATRQFT